MICNRLLYIVVVTIMSSAQAFVLLLSKRLGRIEGWKRPLGLTPPVHSFSTQQSFTAQRNQNVLPLLTKTDVRKMRVAELRELLKSRAMDATGLKQVLVDRLISAMDAPIQNNNKITIKDESLPPLHIDEDSSAATMKSPPIFISTRMHMLRFAGYSNKQTCEAGLGLILYDVETQNELWCARRYYRFDRHDNQRFEFEFHGLTSCLNFLYAHGVNKIILATDSDVVFHQLNGIYQIKKCNSLQSAYWRTILAKEQFATAHLSLSSATENAKTLVLARRAVATKQSFGLEEDKDEERWEQRNLPTSSLDRGTLLMSPIDPSRKYLLRFDGGSRGNPGISGAGMVLYDFDTHSEVWCGWKYLGDMAGHNIAEYTGLLVGLQCAKALGVTKIVVEGDSEFVIRQLEGRYHARNETFLSMHRQCKKELDGFEDVEVRFIPRVDNKRADELANQAMDMEESWGIVTNSAENYGETSIIDDNIHEENPTLLSIDDTGLNTESPIDPEKTYLLRFDGGSRGNPGKSGAGVVLYDTETNAEVWCGWKYLGETGTNNEAEYYAILLGIQCARSLGVHHLIVEGDSLLAVNQLTGAWRVREPKLKVLYDQVKEELKGLETSNIRHIRRELNSRADELANEAMDSEGSGGIDESRRSPTSSPVSSCDDDLPAESSQLEADKSYLLQFDGGSRGNPGKCGAGMVLYDVETNKEVWCGWKYLGADGTNNEAEYNAILLGVKCARSLGVNHLIIEGDSLLAINQLNGDWRVKESRLKVLYDQIKEELKAYKSYDIRHIRRERNKRADELANQAMDSEESWGFDESVSS